MITISIGWINMLYIITSIQDTASYIKLENDNLILTPDIKEATKFKESYPLLEETLKRARKSFNCKFVVNSVNDNLFGLKPRNII